MIDRVGFELNSSVVPNSVNGKTKEKCSDFKNLLTEKAGLGKTRLHGFVGDGQDLCPWLNEDSIEAINAIMALTDDLEDIWKIILQLEEKVDIKVLEEIIAMAFDDSAGENSIAALLVRYWKKKELLGDNISESNVDISAYFNQDYIDNIVVFKNNCQVRI